jgi:hypothetical protein
MTPDEELPDRERRVVRMLRHASATERAPASLRAELQALESGQRRAGGPGGFRLLPGWSTPGGRLRIATVGFLPVAAVVLALVLILGSGSARPTTVMQAASLANRSPTTAAPGVEPAAPRLLTASVQNLHFPDWQAQGGWRSSGTRTDRVAGHAVTTVYYEHAGTQIAYSIVARPTLRNSAPPAGHHYRSFKRDGRAYIVWTDSGHTCLLSSTGVSSDRLWALVRGKTV